MKYIHRRWFILSISTALVPIGCDGNVELPSASVSVDFATTEFPPSARKLGFNGQWNESDSADFEAITAAGEIAAPIVAGIIETKYGPKDVPGPTSTLGPSPLFYRENGTVKTRTDNDLTSLRQAVKSAGMVNLLQLAGTPTEAGVFSVDPSLKETSNGNFYPLPGDPAELAQTFALFAQNVSAVDKTPTIWCFWQEPDHTIGANLTRDESLARYGDLYTKVGPALRAVDRDFVIAGIQQNASAGLSGGGAIDGADYKTWTDHLLAVEAKDGIRYPLDYVTIQNYKGVDTLEIVKNARVAYADERFQMAPLLFNEWDLDKEESFDSSYDSAEKLASFVRQMKVLYDQPDVAYALLMRNIFSKKPLVFPIVQFIDAMSPFRRVFATVEPAKGLYGIASGDDNHVAILAWNEEAGDRPVTFDLKNLSPKLINEGTSITVETISDKSPKLVRQVPVTESTMTLDSVVVPSGGVVMIHAGNLEAPNGLARARYARDQRWVARQSDGSAPLGMGHYDVRDSSLVVGVADKDGMGVASVVVADVPAMAYEITADISMSGLSTSNASTMLSLRLDYLEGDTTTKTLLVHDPAISAATMWPVLPGWPLPGPVEASEATMTHGSSVRVDVTAHAPPTWTTADGGARRVAISLSLNGASGPATVRARISDMP